MSSYLRPRRGKQSTAASTLTSSNPLKRGEIFFEVPTGGVGSGQGKIKMGDGSTAYGSLPYFMSMDDSVVTFTDSSASSTWDNCNSYLGNIKTNISLPTFFANTKNLLYQLVSKVTSLNNDLDSFDNIRLRVKYLDYCGDDGLRMNLPVIFTFNNNSFANGYINIPDGYIISEKYPTIIGTVNYCTDGSDSFFGNSICYINRQTNKSLILQLNKNYNGTLILGIGVRLDKIK